MSTLRVLMISGEYPPMEGGVADFTAILSRAMATQGAEVHVLTSRRARLEGEPGPREVGSVAVYPWMERWSWRVLYDTVRTLIVRHAIDAVNIQYQTAAYGMHPAINFLPLSMPRVPMVVTFHDLLVPYLFPKAGALREWVNLTLARHCRAAIVTNPQDHERLAGVRGMRRIEHIPIGSNISTALPSGYDRGTWRSRWRLPLDSTVLCYFGFLNASKGGEDLVRALGLTVQSGLDARLLMIGGATGASDPTNRTYLDKVQQLIGDLNLGERVTWTGHLPDQEVSACFALSDLCLLPYRDGLSFRRGSLMAALAHGMPIVSTWPQVELPAVRHGEQAWLVPPADPRALADAVRALAADPELRRRLGAGAKGLSAGFGWERIAECTLRLLGEVARD